ncbi:MAG TPA: hypothetical protein VFF31_01450 [Blastocatellia bacterium]|nr:hypothetical protein [Blastocatellia bacterium]
MKRMKHDSFARTMISSFCALLATSFLTVMPGSSLRAGPLSAAPQAAQPCVEDFTSDVDPTLPGLAGSVFSHSISGSFSFWSGFPGHPPSHVLALFAGATDAITFPGQTVTYAKVQIFSFSPGMVIFEGVGDMLTTRFSPAPVVQIREAADTTHGDNDRPLGQIVKVTLIGFETLFDNVEISPCMSTPPTTVSLLIRPPKINPKRNDGVMKAVILSTSTFDAATVDPTTVQFGSATVPFRFFLGDEDEDGDIDLIFFFLVGDVGIQCGDTTVRLTGLTTSGQAIEGEGSIETVGCP